MAKSIGPGGHVNLMNAQVGPERNMKVLAFEGRSDTGFIPHSQFRAGEPPVAVVNVSTGALATAAFSGVVTGGISQTDTGVGDLSGEHFFALVTDTGSAGL